MKLPPRHSRLFFFTHDTCVIPKHSSALALSGTSRAESLRNSLQEDREDLTTFQITIFILLLIMTVVVLLLHFAEAWKVLPGAHLISGIGVPRVEVRFYFGVVWCGGGHAKCLL